MSNAIGRYGFHAESDDEKTYLLQEIGCQCERLHDAAKGLDVVLNEMFQVDESHYDLEGVMAELVSVRAETIKAYYEEFDRLVTRLQELQDEGEADE